MGIAKILQKYNRLYVLSGLEKERNKIFKYKIFCDCVASRYLLGTSVNEYFAREFYNMKFRCRKDFLDGRCVQNVIRICNDRRNYNIFTNKVIFNKHFSEYIRREWIDLSVCTEKEFLDFAHKYPQSFEKVVDGMQGIGVQKLDFHSSDPQKYYHENAGKNIIVEELIQQHHELSEFNDSSVNTIRVIMLLCADDIPRVIGAALRIGRAGMNVDNFHNHGIGATIDIDTGIVFTKGVDAEFNRYIVHPDSGKAIVGFKIPMWEELVAMLKEAALLVPDVRYVGWDVVVRENDVCLVEGNFESTVYTLEVPSHEGVWVKMKPYVEAIRRMKGKSH